MPKTIIIDMHQRMFYQRTKWIRGSTVSRVMSTISTNCKPTKNHSIPKKESIAKIISSTRQNKASVANPVHDLKTVTFFQTLGCLRSKSRLARWRKLSSTLRAWFQIWAPRTNITQWQNLVKVRLNATVLAAKKERVRTKRKICMVCNQLKSISRVQLLGISINLPVNSLCRRADLKDIKNASK